MKNKIVAGIVTYNPQIDRLEQNIEAVIPQVEEVIIVDNGSQNSLKIKDLCKEIGVHFIKNSENYGIATALNQIFNYYSSANEMEKVWILTLDQDSVVYSDIIDEYKKCMCSKKTVSITCLREDRGYLVEDSATDEFVQPVNKCITSGNMVCVDAWKTVGGFNDKLFIDMVDSEFCYRLRMAGFQILRVNKVKIIHELGNAFQVTFMGKNRTILNHSAFRKYYIFRNTTYLLKKYPLAKADYSYYELAKTFIAILLFEEDKFNKIRRAIKGLRDGLRMGSS